MATNHPVPKTCQECGKEYQGHRNSKWCPACKPTAGAYARRVNQGLYRVRTGRLSSPGKHGRGPRVGWNELREQMIIESTARESARQRIRDLCNCAGSIKCTLHGGKVPHRGQVVA